MTTPDIFSMIVQGGSFALVAWLVLHVFRTSIPEFHATIREAQANNAASRKDFSEVLNTQRREFVQEINEARTMNDNALASQRTTGERAMGRLTQMVERLADRVGLPPEDQDKIDIVVERRKRQEEKDAGHS